LKGWIAVAGMAMLVAAAPAVMAGEAPPAAGNAQEGGATDFDVEKLFASTCGWCHSNAGRTAGRGPQLMGTTLTDAEIVRRIKTGKTGAMPAFGAQFTDAQIAAIVRYIRDLKPEGTAP
jgi:mono/diheme cytochrome c family protein